MTVPVPDRRGNAGLRWLRDTPVTTKLAAMSLVFVVVVAVIVGLVAAAMETTAGVRGYVRGEGLWSRGQKDAVYYLSRYASTGEQRFYQRYREAIAIPLGDHRARIELQKPEFDWDIARQGFLQGANDSEDIPSMIRLFRRFSGMAYLREAIGIWAAADLEIAELTRHADELRAVYAAGVPDEAAKRRYQERIEAINARLTPLEHQFSTTLGEGARFIQRMLMGGILAITGALLALALLLAWRISRELRRSILSLRDGALRVASGDLTHPIALRSRDELGDLTQVFNQMVHSRHEAEHNLELRAEELARSNAELERFAYVASHDLQEPLRTLTSFTQLLLRRYADKDDAEAREFSGYILEAAQRMRELIEGLLSYSRVSAGQEQLEPVDLDTLLARALANLSGAISDSGAQVTSQPLPTLRVRPQLIAQLFQNLIGNAIKFRGSAAPEVRISAQRQGREWRFEVRDNGIGVDPKFAERIFVLFQRLHTRERYPGSGLGLAICKKIIELHGGRIWLERSEDGADFRFTLPET